MRLVKTFSLAAVAAAVAMASFGAVSAFAVDQEVTLCTLNVVLCPAESEIYNTGQAFLLTGSNIKFSGNLGEKCEEGDIKGKTLANMGAPLSVDLTSFSFTGCEPCVVITVTATGGGKITMNENGSFSLVVPISIVYTSCIEGGKCAFTSKAVTFAVENTEGGSPIFSVKEQKLGLSEGSALLCGESVSWTGTFTTSEPSPVFLSLYEL